MPVPPSRHFAPVSLMDSLNHDRSRLDGGLRLEPARADGFGIAGRFGVQTLHGIPFDLGRPERPNVILLDPGSGADAVAIDTEPLLATYLVFLHAVEDRVTDYQTGFADFQVDGNELGQHVSDYVLVYDDGSEVVTPIRRRFAIQQLRIGWGASPFEAITALEPVVVASLSEEFMLSRVAQAPYGVGETRHQSGRDRYLMIPGSPLPDHLWLYALPNPEPAKSIRRIVLRPRTERSIVFAVSTTNLEEHPLRPGVRRKLRLALPDGVALNALGELDVTGPSPDVAIDLGTAISARAALDYDDDRWLGAEPDVQPARSAREVIVEYAAHPAATLHAAPGSESGVAFDLAALPDHPPVGIVAVAPAERPVRLRVVDRATGQPVAARLHLHGAAGEYLPPRGHHRQVNPWWFEDNYGEFVNGLNQYAYVSGDSEVDLPLGSVFVEIVRGYETTPIRTRVEIGPETEELTFALDGRLGWRERGWVSADTHVHFLSPQTALLEGAAEGVNVVNLLASQWGEMFSNVADFDGRTTLGARDFGGDGEFLVRVGTENRMQVLGHISLLGYSGAMIHPLCTGGPSESALGDPLEVSMAEWAERCIRQGGLVVLPHAPRPQLERAADIVLELVHGIEMMTFNPFDAQINPYGLADWYRYLNLGYHLPVVGGSDKMAATSLLGGIRTYAHLGERPFTYEEWMRAVKAGNTFVTVGPLLEMTVDGRVPGSRLELPAGGGTLDVAWRVASVSLPIEQVEIVVGGLVAEQVNAGRQREAAGSARVTIGESTWVALRVRGSYRGRHGEIAAHSSAVQVLVGGKPLFAEPDAVGVLEQIAGAIAYVDTIAPRPAAQRYKQVRASLEAAYNRLHQRMHRQGVFHRHASGDGEGRSHAH